MGADSRKCAPVAASRAYGETPELQPNRYSMLHRTFLGTARSSQVRRTDELSATSSLSVSKLCHCTASITILGGPLLGSSTAHNSNFGTQVRVPKEVLIVATYS